MANIKKRPIHWRKLDMNQIDIQNTEIMSGLLYFIELFIFCKIKNMETPMKLRKYLPNKNQKAGQPRSTKEKTKKMET